MNDNRTLEVLKKVEPKAQVLSAELSPKDIQILTTRLTFLWGPVQPNANEVARNEVTKWRHGRSRQVYEEVQDIDNHLFLAVVLSVNPTECAQRKFQPVVNHLRNLRHYEGYHFTPKESTTKALQALADNHHIANNSRYRRLMEGLSHGR